MQLHCVYAAAGGLPRFHSISSTKLVHLPLCSVLHLYDNPLEFLPEISPCTNLVHLTVRRPICRNGVTPACS